MKQKSGPAKPPADEVVRDIRRATRRQFSAEEKIRIVLEGLRGEESIAELCRREGIAASMYYGWSKEFLEAGKRSSAPLATRKGVPMSPDEILKLPSMPALNPSYPSGPYRFVNREYFVVVYETDPDAIAWATPEPLQPDGSNRVFYEWINMPDSSGFGSYEESGVVIPCLLDGEPVNYTAMMFLNDEPPITAGREIWGFPKRWGEPQLTVNKDTLIGTLSYAGERVAMGTMAYKHDGAFQDPRKRAAAMTKTQVNLKLIPGVDGQPEIAQLVAYNLTDIVAKGLWSGPARLHLVPHVHAPVADFPVRRIIGGRHFIVDLTLPYGRVAHDYLAEQKAAALRPLR